MKQNLRKQGVHAMQMQWKGIYLILPHFVRPANQAADSLPCLHGNFTAATRGRTQRGSF